MKVFASGSIGWVVTPPTRFASRDQSLQKRASIQSSVYIRFTCQSSIEGSGRGGPLHDRALPAWRERLVVQRLLIPE